MSNFNTLPVRKALMRVLTDRPDNDWMGSATITNLMGSNCGAPAWQAVMEQLLAEGLVEREVFRNVRGRTWTGYRLLNRRE